MKHRIAFLLTCYNRRKKTYDCLNSLFQIVPNAEVFLVDDASTDGTYDMVKSNFPAVILIKGTGNLYWSRGMYTAWKSALEGDYDFYIWLNDDIVLYPFFLQELLDCYQKAGDNSVITGVIIDRESKNVIYGGTDAQNK